MPHDELNANYGLSHESHYARAASTLHAMNICNVDKLLNMRGSNRLWFAWTSALQCVLRGWRLQCILVLLLSASKASQSGAFISVRNIMNHDARLDRNLFFATAIFARCAGNSTRERREKSMNRIVLAFC
jgi:hypothetical protein